MARPLRIDYPGARHHVMNRGARRQAIFLDDACCVRFLELLAEIHRRFAIVIHGYALMPNHYHLLLEVPRGNLSQAMQFLDGQYARYLNARFGWDGPVWKGRFRNRIVVEDDYWLHLLAYVHLNPVRAYLVLEVGASEWTSHRAYMGLDRCPDWLTCSDYLARFDGREGLREYISSVRRNERQPPEVFQPEALWAPVPSDNLPVEPQPAPRPAPEAALEPVCAVTGLNRPMLGPSAGGRGDHRAGWLAAWWLVERCAFTHGEAASILGVQRAAVSKRLARMRAARGRDEQVEGWIAALQQLETGNT